MIKLTIRLHCDKCGLPYGEPLDFDDDDTSVTRVLDDKRRDASHDGWEVYRTRSGRLEDRCAACLAMEVTK